MPVYRIAPAVFWGAGFSAFCCACAAAALCRRFCGRPVRLTRMLLLLLLGGYLLLVPSLSLFPVSFDPKVGVLHLPWRGGFAAALSPAINGKRLPGPQELKRTFSVCLRNALLLLPFGLLLPASGRRFRGLLPCLAASLPYLGAIAVARLAEYSAGIVSSGCTAEELLLRAAGVLPGFALWRFIKRVLPAAGPAEG